MKFDMSASEFQEFSAALALAEVARVSKMFAEREVSLQTRLDQVVSERDNAWDERDGARSALRDANVDVKYLRSDNEDYMRQLRSTRDELNALRAEVAQLRLLAPNRKENGLSMAFEMFASGPTGKIGAIKQIRELFQLGLKEAKDLVDGVFVNHNYPEQVGISRAFQAYNADDLKPAMEFLQPHFDKSPAELHAILRGKFHTGDYNLQGPSSKPVAKVEDPCAAE